MNNLGRNDLLNTAISELDSADWRAELMVTVICIIGIILLVVLV